jgi:hypothetical protein
MLAQQAHYVIDETPVEQLARGKFAALGAMSNIM